MPKSGYFDTVFALDGDLTPVPDAVQVSGTISYTQGWGAFYSQDPTVDPSTALLIDRAQTNQLFNDVTTAIQQLQQSSAPPFIDSTMNGGTAFSYGAGVRVILDDVIYQSLVDANTDTPPSAKWQIVAGANTYFSGGTSTGSANAQAVASAQASFSLVAGHTITWLAGFSNTGALTLNADGTGAKSVKALSAGGLIALVASDIIVGQQYTAIYDGTQYQLQNPTITGFGFAFSNSGGPVQLLPGGLIMQMVSGSVSTSGVTITLPEAFPNNFFAVVAGKNAGFATVDAAPNGLTGISASINTGGPDPCTFFCWGN